VSKRGRIKKIIASILLGCLVTIISYSVTFNATYPQLTSTQQNYLTTCHEQTEGCTDFTSQEVDTDGFPFRSRITDYIALTFDFHSNYIASPFVVVGFAKTPQIYANLLIWSLVAYALIGLLKKKKYAHTRH